MAMRASKSGDQYHTQVKFETKYDEEEQRGTPGRIVAWVNAVTGADGVPPCPGANWDQMQAHWKDGVVLCKLINKILLSAGGTKIGFKAKASSTFVALSNIENFNNGARTYGVAETGLFQAADLYEGRKAQMLAVINTLSSLGMVANKKGFEPAFDQGPKAGEGNL